jgi:hypothetical protein
LAALAHEKSPGTGEVPRLLISLSFAKAQLVQHFNEVFMPDNRDRIKTEPQTVVFVCEQSISIAAKLRRQITSWAGDPGCHDSIPEFLADCELRGWPIWIRNGTAYVYATGVPV